MTDIPPTSGSKGLRANIIFQVGRAAKNGCVSDDTTHHFPMPYITDRANSYGNVTRTPPRMGYREAYFIAFFLKIHLRETVATLPGNIFHIRCRFVRSHDWLLRGWFAVAGGSLGKNHRTATTTGIAFFKCHISSSLFPFVWEIEAFCLWAHPPSM